MFLKEISDDLLICLVREKYQVAIDLLIDRYTKFLYGIINDFFGKTNLYVDYEDMFHDAFEVFLKCVESYDEESGCFYFFVKKSVERRMIDKLKKIRKNNQVISLDEPYYESKSEFNIDYVADQEDFSYQSTENLYDSLIAKLDEECKKIVDLRIVGYSYGEIAIFLESNKQYVYRKVNKIKNIIKDIMEKID